MIRYTAAVIPTAQGLPVLPNTTVSAGGWVDQAGGTTDLASPLADDNAGTYDQSPANPSAQLLKVGLANTPAPGTGDYLILTIDASQI